MSTVKFQNKTIVSKADSPIQPVGVTSISTNKNVVLVADDESQTVIVGGQTTVSNWIAGATNRVAQAQQELTDLQGLLTFLQS